MQIKLVSWPTGKSLNEITDDIVIATGKVVSYRGQFPAVFQAQGKRSNPLLEIGDGTDADIQKLKQVGIITMEVIPK